MVSPPHPHKSDFARYVAIDVHKQYVVVGGLNNHHEVVLPIQKMRVGRFHKWASKNLEKKDTVVIEATTNTWMFYDICEPLAGKVVVAHPYEVKLIAKARVKTDAKDVFKLARLLVADMIPEVWVPPVEVRELRTLIAHRRHTIKMRTMTYNRLHSLVHRNNLTPPKGGIFAKKNRSWWENLPLSRVEKLRMCHDLAMVDFLNLQINELNKEIDHQSGSEPWDAQMPFLVQLPGFGTILAMTALSAIGDIRRFPTAKHLVSYSGLYPSVHDSGQTHFTGRITKKGRRELRWAMVEAAWTAVQHHPYWREQFQKLSRRMKSSKAIVAIARKLLVVIWHVLMERAADRKANPDMVAFKLMTWSWKLNDIQRGGLTSKQFVRYCLMRLKIGEEIDRVKRAGNRPIASVEEVLGRLPELGLSI